MSKRTELAIFYLYPLLASTISWWLKVNLLASTLLFFAVPAIYLSIKKPRLITRAFLFAALFGLPAFAVIDYLAETNGAWIIENSVFNFRLFEIVPIEQLLWGFFGIYFLVIFYEYFYEKREHPKPIEPAMTLPVSTSLIALAAFILLLVAGSPYLHIHYFYLKMGLVLVLLPITMIIFALPKLTGKIIKTGAYFVVFYFIYEITALHLNQWSFPGQEFIGKISLAGVSFPIEELIFWIILGAMAALSYYEVFDDDGV